MRSLFLASMLSAAALVACGQSLTDNKTGTGGVGTGGSGTGGSGGSVTGTGGSSLQALCNQLATAYDQAVTAAQSCTLGASGQCQLAVPSALSACGACPTFVNDDSKPNAIKTQWQSAGCLDASPPVPCPPGLCLPPPSTCAANDSGGASCGFVSGAGGSGGSPGTGGSSPDAGFNQCDALASKYQAALAVAKTCNVGATGQCGQLVPEVLSVCAGCAIYVNDAGELNEIQAAWTQAGCDNKVGVACPAISCLAPLPSTCAGADAGTGTCTIGAFAAAAVR